jgi:L,D-transpeptidase ErfK/SrfK
MQNTRGGRWHKARRRNGNCLFRQAFILLLGSSMATCGAAALCSTALASTYPLPPKGQSLVGTVHFTHTQKQDTLSEVALRFDLGYDGLLRANPGVDPWLPGDGTTIKLPMSHILPDAQRKGIVINLAEKRLYYYPKAKSGDQATVVTYPVGVGRIAWDTPQGKTRVAQKIKHPNWYPPASIRKEHAERGDPLPKVVPAGDDNPLGHFALRLGMPEYLIHGTNKPYGIGMRVSHGCIRLYNTDIVQLFKSVPSGTSVNIVDQPYKAGWSDGKLYLQAYSKKFSPKKQDEKDGKKRESPRDLTPMVKVVSAAAKQRDGAEIDWERATQVAKDATGIPQIIGRADKGKP